jgi:hypothetical protein
MFVSTTGIIAAQIITNPACPATHPESLAANQALASLPLAFLASNTPASSPIINVGRISCEAA